MNHKNLYHELLLDHYHHPRTKGTIENPDFSSGIHNPSCGDSVVVQGMMDGDMLSLCRFQAQGCVISCAAASLLTLKAQGQSLMTIASYTPQTMLDLVQLPLGPTRLRCALLVLEALQIGIQEICKKRGE